jgi:hypothetical protein
MENYLEDQDGLNDKETQHMTQTEEKKKTNTKTCCNRD